MSSGVELTVAVTLLLALISACVLLGKNLAAIDELKTRSKHLDELPKLVAKVDAHGDVMLASTRQLAKLTDRTAALERISGERHEQVLGALRLLQHTKASREISSAEVQERLRSIPRPRARSVPDVPVLPDDDDSIPPKGA